MSKRALGCQLVSESSCDRSMHAVRAFGTLVISCIWLEIFFVVFGRLEELLYVHVAKRGLR